MLRANAAYALPRVLDAGTNLIQDRAIKHLGDDYVAIAQQCFPLCRCFHIVIPFRIGLCLVLRHWHVLARQQFPQRLAPGDLSRYTSSRLGRPTSRSLRTPQPAGPAPPPPVVWQVVGRAAGGPTGGRAGAAGGGVGHHNDQSNQCDS